MLFSLFYKKIYIKRYFDFSSEFIKIVLSSYALEDEASLG